MFSSKYTLKDFLVDLILCVIGNAAVSFQVAVFTAPNQIVGGGVSGLSTTLAYITPISVGLWSIILNLPLIIAAWRLMGLRAIVFTVISVLLDGALIDWFSIMLPHYTNNVLLASIYAGVCGGFGVGLMFRRGLSTGGTDLLALIINKFLPDVPSGTLLMMIDAAVVLVAVLVFGKLEVALYSMIIIYVGSRVIDAIPLGLDHAKVIYTITDQSQRMSEEICGRLGRGVTIIPATGGYTGNEKGLLVCVVKRLAFTQTMTLIKSVDPRAFTFVVDATEVHGEGYKED